MSKYSKEYCAIANHKSYVKHKKKRMSYNKKIRKILLIEEHRILKELKINGCSICGYDKYIGSLDFHHVNEKKPIIYLNLNGMKWCNDKIITEFHKCMLLCKNCHYEIHRNGDSL
jgi:hypothetical protein